MSNLCNCSNCPQCDKNTGTWDYCNERDIALEPLYTKPTIEQVGCLSHPNARAYLMQDVIEELERLEVESFEYQDIMAYKRIISLIKGVKE